MAHRIVSTLIDPAKNLRQGTRHAQEASLTIAAHIRLLACQRFDQIWPSENVLVEQEKLRRSSRGPLSAGSTACAVRVQQGRPRGPGRLHVAGCGMAHTAFRVILGAWRAVSAAGRSRQLGCCLTLEDSWQSGSRNGLVLCFGRCGREHGGSEQDGCCPSRTECRHGTVRVAASASTRSPRAARFVVVPALVPNALDAPDTLIANSGVLR